MLSTSLYRIFTAIAATVFFTAFTFSAIAQSAQTTDSKTVYRIQVGAYKVIPPGKFDNLATVGSVSLDDAGNGVRRIWVGEYAEKEKAEKALDKVKKLGYEKAFIITQTVQPPQPAATTTTTPAPAKPAAAPATTPAKQETVQKMEYQSVATTPPATTPEPLYLIQLGAYSKYDPNEIKKYSNILDLGQLLMETENDKTRLFLAKFAGKAAAEKALATVKQRGYPEAFIKEDK